MELKAGGGSPNTALRAVLTQDLLSTIWGAFMASPPHPGRSPPSLSSTRGGLLLREWVWEMQPSLPPSLQLGGKHLLLPLFLLAQGWEGPSHELSRTSSQIALWPGLLQTAWEELGTPLGPERGFRVGVVPWEGLGEGKGTPPIFLWLP